MFQNESPYLKEWIEYHSLLGVEHFYLYDNDSDDNYIDILAPYLQKGIVEIIPWPSENRDNWIEDQIKAFNHCIQETCSKTEWLAIIDMDEFIVPMIDTDLVAFLSKYDAFPHIGGVQINWQLYGTSGLASIPDGKLLIESLILKAPTDYVSADLPHNGCVKSIVRPYTIRKYRVHEGSYKPGYFSIPQHKHSKVQPVQVDAIRINHYWTRAEDFFWGRKLEQRLNLMGQEFYDSMVKKLVELNQVEDKCIFKFVPALRHRMDLD